MKAKKRPVKYVVWLSNFTDTRDDEWMTTFARSSAEAEDKCKGKYDTNRFSIDYVMTAKAFRKREGRGFPLGRKCNRLPG
jgi:hypothetical protein